MEIIENAKGLPENSFQLTAKRVGEAIKIELALCMCERSVIISCLSKTVEVEVGKGNKIIPKIIPIPYEIKKLFFGEASFALNMKSSSKEVFEFFDNINEYFDLPVTSLGKLLSGAQPILVDYPHKFTCVSLPKWCVSEVFKNAILASEVFENFVDKGKIKSGIQFNFEIFFESVSFRKLFFLFLNADCYFRVLQWLNFKI